MTVWKAMGIGLAVTVVVSLFFAIPFTVYELTQSALASGLSLIGYTCFLFVSIMTYMEEW